ncbi:MAG TPA: tRNA (adenosine(37)-N6)-dimethylallyltransferase MiaA [Steroidobacteraceae bacterium]|jgi:tRNA dimethylallyltransferase|nr:tRNA (adenosine(37)-N6)-dimethylallyltransferase MiaA [Steroidobacteraceae bacterium]
MPSRDVSPGGAGARPGAGGPHRRAILLMGPTGAGKSDIALRLAECLPVEIVSVDSALVYRGMDIGTAKPTAAMRARVPHHLIDVRDPAQPFSAGEFTREALAAMEGIWRRGRYPLLTGGTMLYFHALTHGIASLPEADLEVRAALDARAAAVGWAALHGELERIDPAAAARIHVNDPQRIQRALEVFELTGRSITSLQQLPESVLGDADIWEFAICPLERRELHSKIELRFDSMLQAGLVAEVRTLMQRGDLTAEHPSMRAVGYRQVWQHLTGQSTLIQARDQALAATRQLAKRQLTWLRRRERAQWLDSLHPDCARAIAHVLHEAGFAAVTPREAVC